MDSKDTKRFFLEKKQAKFDLPLVDTSMRSLTNYWIIVIAAIAINGTEVATNFVPNNLKLVTGIYQIAGPLLLYLLLFKFIARQPLKKLYQHFSWLDLSLAVIFIPLYLGYSQLASVFISGVENKAVATNTSHGTVLVKLFDFTITALTNVPTLMVEELFGIILFLGLAAMVKNYGHQSRNLSIWIALIISMVIFGLMHFYVYDWHLGQMILIIGVLRLMGTGLYIRSRSIWPAFIFHWGTDTFIAFILAFWP